MTLPEFRLYYDDNGNVLHYTCEQSTGNFVVIDAQTYAEGRHDVIVVNGKIEKIQHTIMISKLAPNKEGTECATADISIVAKGYESTIHWALTHDKHN